MKTKNVSKTKEEKKAIREKKIAYLGTSKIPKY